MIKIEKTVRIGIKIAINGGKRHSDGVQRLVIYLPQHVIERLEIKPGDELEVGEVYKTGRNLLRRRSGFQKKTIQSGQVS